MRSIALALTLFFGTAVAAVAQASHGGDVALTYHWVHTNRPPDGGCGCFGLNGGGISGSWSIASRWAAVAEISAEDGSNVLSQGQSLTLTSYMAGARYYIPQPWRRGAHTPQPFGQLLLGAAQAGGGVAGAGDDSYAFATRMGGGLDVPLSSVFAIRVVQVDYYLTTFANSVNDRQNNLLVGAGISFRWPRRQ
jgi:outer membrane immunogenic protein